VKTGYEYEQLFLREEHSAYVLYREKTGYQQTGYEQLSVMSNYFAWH